MAIESHKCNTKGCDGWVSFENADFNFNETLDTIKGYYAFTDTKCNKCGKEFLVVPHWAVINPDGIDKGDWEEI
jgi:hypothetical protein